MVAVSGGVDSVVLLDILAKMPALDLVVAHFDHGIRPDSNDDAEFVHSLAAKYGLPFETKRVDLGAKASEEKARLARYEFLREVAKKHDAKIATAHHADDIIETIAINNLRGTGWRGLAVLSSHDIVRPLNKLDKTAIMYYALTNRLNWHEDSTNHTPHYLRNRIRRKISDKSLLSDTSRGELHRLHERQLELKRRIDHETASLATSISDLSAEGTIYYKRHFFIQASDTASLTILRHITHGLLTRPQLQRVLLEIKTARPGALYHAGRQLSLKFTKRYFQII